ncbi:hypothetical protein SAMN04244553_3574 [Nocardia amikacinitolerans]|uniref:DUF4352 domain-containing protein n=2 Tax=Nocardia amikacinitolerans TaxID=756689 RepID=A0A285LKJ2_9NOCA|nr:hypothetical protein SAMN04244553_3574 [Nocardia amikacinitolerans]
MRAAAVLFGVATAAAVLSGCGSNDPAPKDAGATTSAEPASDLGKTYTISKAEGGTSIGSVRFVETVEIPSECLQDPAPAGTQSIAVRVEVVNDSALEISRPGSDLLQVNDSGGFSQTVEEPLIDMDCRSRFPELAVAPTPGKAAGWVFIQSPVTNPSALVYTPLVWAEDASIDNLDVVRTKPTNVVVRLLPIAPAAQTTATPTTSEDPAPTTEVEPPPPTRAPVTTRTAAPAAPIAGAPCSPVNKWAKDSAGQQLLCAYAGGPTLKWVESLPLIGNRAVGSPCEGYDYVAQSPSGQPLLCLDDTWQPGP